MGPAGELDRAVRGHIPRDHQLLGRRFLSFFYMLSTCWGDDRGWGTSPLGS